MRNPAHVAGADTGASTDRLGSNCNASGGAKPGTQKASLHTTLGAPGAQTLLSDPAAYDRFHDWAKT